jgi:uncharacterized protein (TIGR02265 family)
MSEARIKGGILISRLKYVRDRGGEAALERVIARLDRADQDVLRGILVHGSWYPLALNLRLDDAIADELSPANRSQIFIEMGKKSAEVNLTGAHRIWLCEGDPHGLLAKSSRIYGMYYAVGRRTYEKTGERSAVLRTFEAEQPTAADCLTVVGWYIRAIEMCGGRNVRVRETCCRAYGAAHCEYLCEWE